jgi:hypothetical protein
MCRDGYEHGTVVLCMGCGEDIALPLETIT